MKIVPAGLTFEQALLRGYLGRLESPAYIMWIKSLPCDGCGATPVDPSHMNNYHKGHGTKLPDWWAIPQCRACHENYERHGCTPQEFLARAALYLLRAIVEGVLTMKGARNGK